MDSMPQTTSPRVILSNLNFWPLADVFHRFRCLNAERIARGHGARGQAHQQHADSQLPVEPGHWNLHRLLFPSGDCYLLALTDVNSRSMAARSARASASAAVMAPVGAASDPVRAPDPVNELVNALSR